MNTEWKPLNAAFEKWWQEEGQYCRAGGSDYEKTFAYHAYQAALDSAPTSHPIPTGATGERDWELACDECNGSGHVFVKHQVAERKTDVQEFKEECEACEGRGFNIAFEDIPGISEYVKSCRPAATAATEGEKKEAVAYQMRLLTTGPHGEWQACTQETYESTKKTGTYCGFRNGPAAEVRALPAPAAGDALDAKRYRHLRDHGVPELCVCIFGTPSYIGATPENPDGPALDATIDAALAAIAQQSQRKEA